MAMIPAAFAESYVVIVNTSNSLSGDQKQMEQQVKRAFLKQATTWPSGAEVKAFDRAKGAPESIAFISSVLGMDEAEVARYWLGLKQKTGETPPRNVSSSSMVKRLVTKYEGGIAVIKESEATDLPDGVKVLFKF